jgi:hypothetical protein
MGSFRFGNPWRNTQDLFINSHLIFAPMLAEFIITDGTNYGDPSEKDDEEHRHAAINLNINGEDRSVSIGKFDVKKPITVHRAVALLSHDLGLLEDPPELSELLGDKDLDSGKQMSNEERDAATRS